MIKEITDYLPIFMLLAVSLGFLIGDESRRRIHAEERVIELTEDLEDLKRQIKLLSNTPTPAVTKGSPEHPG
jgi:hypothetical protein